MKFMQINEDTLDFITSSIPVRNSKDPLEIPDELKDHPEVARALKIDSIRVWVEPEKSKAQTRITKPDANKEGE
jgi:hypothetical protein